MAATDFWLFVSAVSNEFRTARSEIAADLKAQGFNVKEQQDFGYEQESETLLAKLHDYIFDCDAVVAIVGEEGGASPSAEAVAPFSHMLPEDLKEATYTQWEVIFADYYGKTLLLYCTKDAVSRMLIGVPPEDTSQRRYIRWIDKKNLQRVDFSATAELIPAIQNEMKRQDWHRIASRNSEFPEQIAKYVRRAQGFFQKRLAELTGGFKSNEEDKGAYSIAEIRQHVAQRTAEDKDRKIIVLPREVLRAAELTLKPAYSFKQSLVVGGAGEGKTTLVHSLLCELARERSVCRWKLVPILADCVTLSRLLHRDGAHDDEAIIKWLSLAIRLNHLSQSNPTDARANERIVADFMGEIDRFGYKILLVIDGLDELDPSGASDLDEAGRNPVERVLLGLHQWEEHWGIDTCYRIATTRPYFQNIEHITGMSEVKLCRPSAYEVERLAKASGVPSEQQARFREMFQNPNEIDSKLVYFRPLVRYFKETPDELANKDAVVSRYRLMELEVDHAIEEIVHQLRMTALSHTGVTTTKELKQRLRNVLVRIALELLAWQDPDKPGNMGRRRIASLAAKEGFSEERKLFEGDRLLQKILDVFVIFTRDAGGLSSEEFYFRFPHNEYRDFLLADGLFRLIRRQSPPGCLEPNSTDAQHVAAMLARSYRRSERTKVFLEGMLDHACASEHGDTRELFKIALIDLMNDRQQLPDDAPGERADCSAHGSLMTLLLTLGKPPREPVLQTANRNFHGMRVPTNIDGRSELPGNKNWRNTVLQEADLRGASLAGFDLTGADLDNARMNGADLTGAKLARAKMRNIAMGCFRGPTVLTNATFDDGLNDVSGADWFNYRFQGLKGYYCFWDIEPVMTGRYVLIAGSRAQLLLFDLNAQVWEPVYIQTQHEDDIFDVTSHPTQNLFATTSRDNTVRFYRLPAGEPHTWPTEEKDGLHVHVLQEQAKLGPVFTQEHYARRSRFSKSGRWLAVIGRDPRVAFFKLPDDLADIDKPMPRYDGRVHTGPVMCLETDTTHDSRDRFYTAGYDGRLTIWSKSEKTDEPEHAWADPLHTLEPATTKNGEREIIRALIVASGERTQDGLWIGTELDGSILRYRKTIQDLRPFIEEDIGFYAAFPDLGGVFSLALSEKRGRVAVGFANGDVRVFEAKPDKTIDWTAPRWRCHVGDDIIRSLQFFDSGTKLLAASWDAKLALFALADTHEGSEITAIQSFDYPDEQWRPEWDVENFEIDGIIDLQRSRGISTRMKLYLAEVGKARNRSGLNDK